MDKVFVLACEGYGGGGRFVHTLGYRPRSLLHAASHLHQSGRLTAHHVSGGGGVVIRTNTGCGKPFGVVI